MQRAPAVLRRAALIASMVLPISCAGSAASNVGGSGEPGESQPEPGADAPPNPEAPESQPADEARPETSSPTSSASPGPITCAPDLIESQAELDVLEGCEIATTNVGISFAGADLRPLHALRIAHQGVTVGTGFGDIPSLEGLENLERAPLELQGVLVEDLRSLGKLQSLAPNAEPTFDGVLSITNCPNLKSLDGLGRLVLGKGPFIIAGNPLLTSLSPLDLPNDAGFIELNANPSLRDLAALHGVEHMNYLRFREMPQATLDDFSALRSADVIEILASPGLEDVTGITNVESVWSMTFYLNPLLGSIPPFPRLTRASSITVWGNNSLVRVDGFPALGSLLGFDPEGIDGGSLQIVYNTALTQVALGPTLAQANTLEIRNNPALVALDLDTLSAVNALLIVTSNPQLEPSTLAKLEAMASPLRKIGANDPDAIPLDPCPWTVDRRCDEGPVDGVCALGTDAVDCRNDPVYVSSHSGSSSK